MRRHRELMERLAAADPAAAGERPAPDGQREAEALLARLLATPPEAGEQRGGGRRGMRRWAPFAASVVGAAAAALAATSLIDSDVPGTGVVERAVAAVTRDGVIYHVVERSRIEASYEPNGVRTHYVESWHTSDGRIHRTTYAAKDGGRGRVLEDWAGRRLPGRRVWPRLRWDAWTNTISEGGFGPGPDTGAPGLDLFGDHGAQLRELQEEGRLRVAGTTRVGDRPAYRLVSGPVPDPEVEGEERVEFLVDAETYLPLAQRFSARSRSTDPADPITRIRLDSRYLVYERLPLNARNRELLHLDTHPGAKCSDFAHELRGEQGVGYPNPCPKRSRPPGGRRG
jgi:hypothetical protein